MSTSSKRIRKEKVKCKWERLGRDEMEIKLGMCVDVCECTYMCVCVYVYVCVRMCGVSCACV